MFEEFFYYYDIVVAGDKYLIEIDMPGVSVEKIELAIQPMLLTVNVNKEEKKEDYKYIIKGRMEISKQHIIPIPEDVDMDKIKATLKDGVLRIEIGRKIGKKIIEIKAV
jgi:HSP20 family protein